MLLPAAILVVHREHGYPGNDQNGENRADYGQRVRSPSRHATAVAMNPVAVITRGTRPLPLKGVTRAIKMLRHV